MSSLCWPTNTAGRNGSVATIFVAQRYRGQKTLCSKHGNKPSATRCVTEMRCSLKDVFGRNRFARGDKTEEWLVDANH